MRRRGDPLAASDADMEDLAMHRTDSYLAATAGAVIGDDTGVFEQSKTAATSSDTSSPSAQTPNADEGDALSLDDAEGAGLPFVKRADQRVGCFSRMIFSWVSPIVRTGFKRVLQNEVRTNKREQLPLWRATSLDDVAVCQGRQRAGV